LLLQCRAQKDAPPLIRTLHVKINNDTYCNIKELTAKLKNNTA